MQSPDDRGEKVALEQAYRVTRGWAFPKNGTLGAERLLKFKDANKGLVEEEQCPLS